MSGIDDLTEKKDGGTGSTEATPMATTTVTPKATSEAGATTPAAVTPDASTTTSGVTPVMARLAELGVDDAVADKIVNVLGAKNPEDLDGLTEADLISVGMLALPARTVLGKLRKATVDTTVATAAAGTISFDGVLPEVPDEGSWISALRAGGVLKVNQSTVISAVRAALAHRAGLFKVPALLAAAMESFADESQEQVDAEFFKIKKQITRRSYADIFGAIDGLDGSFVTESRKKLLFERIDNRLWPSIISFNNALKMWQESWAQGANNPAILMQLVVGAGSGAVLPPGMMQPPDTGILRDEAAAVADSVNAVFSGTGVQIAAALAYDAVQIKETLSNPSLPALVGAPNREQMLRKLGVAVSPTYPRLETNLTRFVLATMQAQDQPSGSDELRFFGSLYMLGSQIQWDQIGTNGSKKATGIGAGSARRGYSQEEL